MAGERLARTWIDLEALHEAVDDARIGRGMSWRDVARDLGVCTPSVNRMRDGSRLDCADLCLLCDWVGADVSIDGFRVPYGTRVARGARGLTDDELYQAMTSTMRDGINERVYGTTDA